MAENFDLTEPEDESSYGELRMSVSAVCHKKDGEKYAFVYFSDQLRSAEGLIPECKISKNKGFAKIEVEYLEKYMRDNLEELKKMAAEINIFDAFMK